MADKFVWTPGAIDHIAKSGEMQQLCLGIAKGVASAASSLDPSEGASYSADVVVGRTRARARAKAKLPDSFKERRKWRESMPLFRVQPRI